MIKIKTLNRRLVGFIYKLSILKLWSVHINYDGRSKKDEIIKLMITSVIIPTQKKISKEIKVSLRRIRVKCYHCGELG